jgi:uncharacterized protein
MKFNRRFLFIAFAFLFFGQVFSQMIILSGPEKGSYNRFVKDMVKVLSEKEGITLLNRTTGGSGSNFKEISDPSSPIKIGLVQSDYLNLMQAEDKLNNTNKTGSIKVVLQLAEEEIQIVAKKSSGFRGLRDMEKKKVGIGTEDQGSYATGKIINERSKVNWTSYYVPLDKVLKEISSGNIDAGLIVGSAPVNILDLDPQIMVDGITILELDDFDGWAKYYENDTVYLKDYKWLDKDVPTFGVRTLLIVNEAKLSGKEQQAVAAIKSGIIKNLDILRKQGHPKWKDVIVPDEPETASEKNTLPVKADNKVNATRKDAVVYKVQIYSRNYQKNDDEVYVDGKTYKTNVYLHMGAYRYTIGEFTSLSSAIELQNSSRKSGYPQAFVAAFKNNIRSADPDLFK